MEKPAKNQLFRSKLKQYKIKIYFYQGSITEEIKKN
jgi:hypothetical protein